MRTIKAFGFVWWVRLTPFLFLFRCASAPPPDLSARAASLQIEAIPTAMAAPAALPVATVAPAEVEESFVPAQLIERRMFTDLGDRQGTRVEAERKAAASEDKAVVAGDALAKLASKEEQRGTVITLSGSVLFHTNDAVLQPSAEAVLDEIAVALRGAPERTVVVEGHTDSRGSPAANLALSQRRADAVRSYIVAGGYPGEKIEARGMGGERPVAENATAEGRANNRRVAIVIQRPSYSRLP